MATFQHPLGPPTISGTKMSLDVLLNQPSRVNRFLQALTLQKFAFPNLFANGGVVTGGAVEYDQEVVNELYPVTMPEKIAPGMQFPVLVDARLAPKIAPVAKWGGKIFITDEARDRNDQLLFARAMRKVGNAMVKTIDSVAMAAISAQITAIPALTSTGSSWSAVVTNGATPTNTRAWPHADIAVVLGKFDTDELGEEPNVILLNTLDNIQLGIIYGQDGRDAMLASFGLRPFVTNRIAAGSAIIAVANGVGEYKTEKPLSTVTYREESTERTWVQTGVRNVFYVTNPYAMRQLTALA